MASSDETHFDTYRQQTSIKHAILTKYLPAYFTALKKNHEDFVYIDGFAGRGTYSDPLTGQLVDGSPLRAMKAFAADSTLKDRVQCMFIEPRDDHFEQLKQCVDQQQVAAPLRKPPRAFKIEYGHFSDQVFGYLESKNANLAPTFLFADPCGVSGVRLQDLAKVLSRDYCEVFIFFNYEGVNRIAGLAQDAGSSPTLIDLFGSADRLSAVLSQLDGAKGSEEREQILVKSFCDALRVEGKAKYILPFRIEKENRRSTSHYLLYATKHYLGFKIMKDIMWKLGRDENGDGGLELVQASRDEGSIFLRPELAAQESQVLSELAIERRQVSYFSFTLVIRPDDMYSSRSYKDCLLRLEREGKIVVYDKANNERAPASSRRKNKGEATLGDDYWVAIS